MNDPYLSWQNPNVAKGMLDLALQKLQDENHPPYRYFLRALEYIDTCCNGLDGVFLDAGCGVGHYGELLARHYPGVKYRAFDFSEAMIQEAKKAWPDRQCAFWVADAKTFDYSVFDYAFASSLIETMDNWVEGVEAICKTASNIVILHRVRYGERTERFETDGYSEQKTWRWIHNEAELLDFFEDRSFHCLYVDHWDTSYPMATYIFMKNDKT